MRAPRHVSIVIAAAGAYFLGQSFGWGLAGLTSLKPPNMPTGDRVEVTAAWFVVSTLLIAVGVAPAAAMIRGSIWARLCTLTALIYLLHTANTAIELAIFTKFQGQLFFALAGLPPALACGAVSLRHRGPGAEIGGSVRIKGDIAWRIAVCWLAFPFVYYLFGSLVIPFVIEDYMNEAGMLFVPEPGVLISVQCVRSMLFLIPSVAVIERWSGSRRGLWLVLGWAHAALAALSGLVMPNPILSPALRLIHAVEITADSFVYCGILVVILTTTADSCPKAGFESADSLATRTEVDRLEANSSGSNG